MITPVSLSSFVGEPFVLKLTLREEDGSIPTGLGTASFIFAVGSRAETAAIASFTSHTTVVDEADGRVDVVIPAADLDAAISPNRSYSYAFWVARSGSENVYLHGTLERRPVPHP